MNFSMLRLLRSLDTFGHPIKVNYKGEETYNSALGGILTLAMYALTLVLVERAFTEIFTMQEPSLSEYMKPLSRDEKLDMGDVGFADKNFVFGLYLTIYSTGIGDDRTMPSYQIPQELGQWHVNL